MKTALIFIAGFIFSVAYVGWLNSGCELSGVMTWQGKVCAEDLLYKK